MSLRMLLRIVAVLAVVIFLWGALAIWKGRRSDHGSGLTLPRLSPDSVEQIVIGRDSSMVTVIRTGGAWTVNGYPADHDVVGRFLTSMRDSVLASELVAESPTSHVRLGVDSVAGKRLTVTAGGKAVLDLWVGNRGPEFEGFYMRPVGKDEVYLERGDFAEFSGQNVDEWRDHQIAGIPTVNIGKVEVTRGKASYSVTRSGDTWMLAKGPTDSIKVRRFLAQFVDLRSGGFPSKAQEDSARFSPPDRSVTLLSTDGKPLLSLVLDSMAAGWWIRRADGGAIFRIEDRVGGTLAPPESSFVN